MTETRSMRSGPSRSTASNLETSGWPHELRRIVDADDLHVAPFREDGVTYGTPTWIWSVAVDSALYVRAYNGRSSRWYQAAMRQKAGRIVAARVTKEVTFEPVGGRSITISTRRIAPSTPEAPISRR